MDFKTFLENFDAIAQVPNGIPKLRSLILDLAVRGKLVPQNSEDEPAEQLFEKVQASKEILYLQKKATKKKDFQPLNDEAPFSIPNTWKWTKLHELCWLITDGTHHTPTYIESGIPFLSVKNLSRGYLDFSSTRFITRETHEELCNRCKPEYGDILLTKVGTTGIAVEIDTIQEFSIFVSVALLKHFSTFTYPRFLAHLLNSPFVKAQSEAGTEGVGNKNLVLRKIYNFLVPLPPLAEQKRIVEKVDELMALCDRLQSSQQSQANLRQKLRASAIASLMNAETDEELKQSWAIVRDNWHTLSQKPEDVSDLRRSVLQLAVRGKLVPQYLEDGDAKCEVEEIFRRTKELEKLGKLSKQKIPIPLSNDLPYEIPKNWSWERFVKVASIESNLVKPDNYGTYPHIAPNYIEKSTGRLLPYQTIAQDQVTSPKHYFYPGQIIYSKIRPNLNKLVLVDFEGLCSADMYPISTALYTRYLLMFMLSKYFLDQVTLEDNRLAMPKVNQEQLSQVLIAVPPTAEQKRIVAKVDELMQMCDQLEESLRQSQQRAEALAASAISHLEI